MPKGDKLTSRQERFVAEYMIDGNATLAYERAGYAGNRVTAGINGHKLLKNAKIQAAIKKANEKVVDRALWDAALVRRKMLELLLEVEQADEGVVQAPHQLRCKILDQMARVEGLYNHGGDTDGKANVVFQFDGGKKH